MLIVIVYFLIELMKMPTNEEKRRVALQLRDYDARNCRYKRHPTDVLCYIAKAIGFGDRDGSFVDPSYHYFMNSLADYIDPDSEQTSSAHNLNEFKVGDVVWHKNGKGPLVVVRDYDSQYDYVFCREADAKYGVYRPYVLTKEKPKTYFGKDNLPVKKNDRVWYDNGIGQGYDGPYIVDRVTKDFAVFAGGGCLNLRYVVHHIPNDSWDKIIDDACSMTPKEYCEKYKISVKFGDYAEKKSYDLKNRTNILIKRYEEEME